MKKILVIGIIFLFIGICANTSLGTIVERESSIPISSGNILYVGGTGPGNYSSIQDAIDDAWEYFTIFVYDDSSPYYEHILVYKTLTIIGENRDTTIIDGNFSNETIVIISADGVDFSGFTIQNSNETYGLMVTSSHNNIHHCRIRNHIIGMYFQSGFIADKPRARRNIIAYNIFENNSRTGLKVTENIWSSIIGNIAINNGLSGIAMLNNLFCTVKENLLIDNLRGIFVSDFFTKVINNEMRNNWKYGLYTYQGEFNIITKNNFYNNGEDNYTHATFMWCNWQNWKGNYWFPRKNLPSESSKPYIIYRERRLYTPIPFNFDWRPAKEPYDI